jgi:hypothetical protein
MSSSKVMNFWLQHSNWNYVSVFTFQIICWKYINCYIFRLLNLEKVWVWSPSLSLTVETRSKNVNRQILYESLQKLAVDYFPNSRHTDLWRNSEKRVAI